MIDIKNGEHFIKVMDFAVANNCAHKLIDKLNYLMGYADGSCDVELHYDFAPNSFVFIMLRRDGTRWFNGGLIYSGPGQPLDGSGPAFTVSLAPTGQEHNWSVHT